MRLLYSILIGVVGVPALALADLPAPYERLGESYIGRVFLSPAERANLDRQRRGRPANKTNADSPRVSASQPVPAKTSSKPAGYIIIGSGGIRHWQNGDFVAAGATATALSFPGEVKIVRHPNHDDAAAGADAKKGQAGSRAAAQVKLEAPSGPDTGAGSDD